MSSQIAESLRAAMRTYPTGVTIVTTIVDTIPHAFTANAFTSVSLDPPSILICVNRKAKSHALISRAGIFCINILTLDQRSLATHFARTGDDAQFDGIEWTARTGGSPRLPGSLAWIDCAVTEEHSVSTHTIFVGNVVEGYCTDGRPLGYVAGEFHDFGIEVTNTTAS
jgi:flavin reductase (DIM6/NTAB) family NADH-FMN oxidoreductase RutF